MRSVAASLCNIFVAFAQSLRNTFVAFSLTMENDEQLNRLFRALGDTTRRRIIDELSRRDRQSLFEVYTRVVTRHGIGQTRQAFSRHLTTLEEVGIIEVEWEGTTKLHTLNTGPIASLQRGWIATVKPRKESET